MSRHHRAQKWTTHAPKLRVKIQAQIEAAGALPCVECGQPVTPQHRWQVGHRRDAARGGRPTLANVGPVHQRSEHWPRNCNQIAGGKLGATIVNGRRQASKDIRPW